MTGWRSCHPRIIAAPLAGALLLAALHAAAAGPGEPAHANRLIDSRSPYLLLHADNPVDWFPWGAEAFAKARRENKPIFLSVGYSTCYWCHVAERTLYSDPEIAALMNRWFVNVKVDREQLPDVDQVYMLARQLLTGRDGWPNNVFLTPDLKPFFAGSYFPPQDDGSGRPAFPSVLEAVHQAWTDETERMRRMADQVHAAMRDSQESLVAGGEAPVAPKQWLARARQILLQRFDPIHGGLRAARNDTKFPLAPMLGLLLADYRISRHPEVLKTLTTTLDAMARGGIRDQLDGGFHRYSTERTWSVPHFEKMLYDNAQLLGLYAEAYEATGNPLYRLVATGVGDYLSRRMTSPRGGFYTAEDSQVDGEEGASYLWTRDQIESILGAEDAHAFFEIYALAPLPTPLAPGAADTRGRGVLRVGAAAAAGSGARLADRLSRLAPQRRKLLAARDRRPQPARDDKIIVAQNGLAIRALAESGEILGIDRYGALARRAAERVWALAWDSGTAALKHEIFRGQAQTDGYLADYALLGVAMMSLHATTGGEVWLRRAGSLADALLRRFSRADGGLAISTGERQLLIVPEDSGDDIHPSGSSAAVALLLDLAAATGAPRYASAAARALRRLSRRIDARPEFWPTAVIAVNLHPPTGDAGPASAGPGRFRMPDSADRVHASAAVSFGQSHDQITVILDVDDGYHINANPASLDYLIATAVVFDGVSPTRIAYPEASRFKPAFAAEALDVYQGRVAVRATFPKGALAAGGTVRATATVQACDDQTCLPPADLPLVVDLGNPNPR